jgi:tyrosine-protein kinase Etk/Wzc
MENDNQQFWLNLFLTLLRWRKFLFVTVFSVAVIVAGISLLLPNWYRGEAAILPPENQTQGLSLSSFVPSIIGAMELPVMASPSDVIASMAQSRTVIDSVIMAMNLEEVYGTDKIDKAVKEFRGLLSVKVLDNGIIDVSYLSKDPQLAADVTNKLLHVLDHVNRNVTVTKARNTRVFIQSRLKEVRASLQASEDSLAVFQTRHQAMALDDQTKAQIEIVAKLEGERALAEVERDLLASTLSPNHPQVRAAAERVRELTKQIDQMQYGGDSTSAAYLLRRPLVDVPDLAIELARLMRSVKTNETIYELLMSQFEQAKIEESRNTSTISVLDYASVPELKDKPKRSQLVLLAVLISLILSLLWIWLIEYLLQVKQKDPARFTKVKLLLDQIWLPRLSKRLRKILNP